MDLFNRLSCTALSIKAVLVLLPNRQGAFSPDIIANYAQILLSLLSIPAEKRTSLEAICSPTLPVVALLSDETLIIWISMVPVLSYLDIIHNCSENFGSNEF